jgi:hypothetical protein
MRRAAAAKKIETEAAKRKRKSNMSSLPTQEMLLVADECQKMTQFLSGLPPGYLQLLVGYFDEPEYSDADHLEKVMESLLSDKLGLKREPHMVYMVQRFDKDGAFEWAQVYFLLHEEDVRRDDVCHKRMEMGMRWWEDELGNDRHAFHPNTVLRIFPSTWPGGKRGCDPNTLDALAALPTSL